MQQLATVTILINFCSLTATASLRISQHSTLPNGLMAKAGQRSFRLPSTEPSHCAKWITLPFGSAIAGIDHIPTKVRIKASTTEIGARRCLYADKALIDLFRRKPTFLHRHCNGVSWSSAAGSSWEMGLAHDLHRSAFLAATYIQQASNS